jgi:hypothetical protein
VLVRACPWHDFMAHDAGNACYFLLARFKRRLTTCVPPRLCARDGGDLIWIPVLMNMPGGERRIWQRANFCQCQCVLL